MGAMMTITSLEIDCCHPSRSIELQKLQFEIDGAIRWIGRLDPDEITSWLMGTMEIEACRRNDKRETKWRLSLCPLKDRNGRL